LTTNEATINTSSLPSGIYLLRSDTFVIKLIKQ
ncbi:MAG: T9SS type A sorting domain-containing protein, partial [Cyclobacteriaceae bacterium]